MWCNFGLVFKNDKKLDLTACKNCKKVYTFKKDTGTTTMKKHKCRQNKKLDDTKLIEKYVVGSKKLTKIEKKELNIALANFCAKDLRPFEIIKGI